MSRVLGVLTLAIMCTIAIQVCAQSGERVPVIAIVTDPEDLPEGNASSGWIWNNYVKWLGQSAIRTVPIRWEDDFKETDELLSKVNGVLFPGGGVDELTPLGQQYLRFVRHIFDKAIDMYSHGDPFVLWGTCQGFQYLCMAAAESTDALEHQYVGMYPLMMSMNFTPAASSSRLYGNASPRILTLLKDKNTTVNYHHDGVPPTSFVKFPKLGSAFRSLSTANDLTGRAFVASIEAMQAPIFGIQFHPEKVPYQFNSKDITHDLDSLEVSHYFSIFLREQLLQNNHSFATQEEAEALMVETNPMVYFGKGTQGYLIPKRPETNGEKLDL